MRLVKRRNLWTDETERMITALTWYHTKDKPQDRIQHSPWSKSTSLSHILSRFRHMCTLSIFVGLGLKRDGDKKKVTNLNRYKVRTLLGTAASIPTMCFVHKARTIGARIARSVMFARSISGRNGRMNIFERVYDRIIIWNSRNENRYSFLC